MISSSHRGVAVLHHAVPPQNAHELKVDRRLPRRTCRRLSSLGSSLPLLLPLLLRGLLLSASRRCCGCGGRMQLVHAGPASLRPCTCLWRSRKIHSLIQRDMIFDQPACIGYAQLSREHTWIANSGKSLRPSKSSRKACSGKAEAAAGHTARSRCTPRLRSSASSDACHERKWVCVSSCAACRLRPFVVHAC